MMVTVGLCVACCTLLGVSSAAHQRQQSLAPDESDGRGNVRRGPGADTQRAIPPIYTDDTEPLLPSGGHQINATEGRVTASAASSYPSPFTHPADCNRQGLQYSCGVCDPDHLLSYQAADSLERKLMSIRTTAQHTCQHDNSNKHTRPFHIAVVLASSVDPPADLPSARLVRFASVLAHRYGLGNSGCGGDGIVLAFARRPTPMAVVAAKPEAAKYITPAFAQRLNDKSKRLFAPSASVPIGEGLETLLDDMAAVLPSVARRGVPVWLVIVLTFLGALLVCLLVAVCLSNIQIQRTLPFLKMPFGGRSDIPVS
ncbi:unnamed protein product [Vitrella brassicaformis CCMP3155]|uniref:TPM domain-containing protein n=1 Tax=Vitrella brassicaformis (strain CCMP3155) TaxID=1169540 RepID=A0A0G4F539_VITBC|nr:unnamed protein product [Vitrella brassicaformis CCMP3155]|eukprot:CEM06952.1 unnamed protein product [Vitrella brassicaformis CCMP3155]